MKDLHKELHCRVIDKIKHLTQSKKDIAVNNGISITTMNRIMSKDDVSENMLERLDRNLKFTININYDIK